MLDPTLFGEVAPADLAERTGIPVERLRELIDRSGSPSIYELGQLADALSTNPTYLIRPRPSLIALRDSGVDNAELNALLEQFDLHVEAYSAELAQPEVVESFPAKNPWGARSAGSGWASRHGVLWAGVDRPDPLVEVVEAVHRIPILIWPVPDAPFGATLHLNDTLAIWVNSHDVPGTQQRFTLAHELGHIMLRHTDIARVEQTDSAESAPSVGDAVQRQREEYANAFAGGVLYDHDRITAHWDGETSPVSVAHTAANLGLSFEAALVGMKIHLGGKVFGIEASARTVQPYEAFRTAGYGDYVDWYYSLLGQRRIPAILEHHDLLEQALARLTNP